MTDRRFLRKPVHQLLIGAAAAGTAVALFGVFPASASVPGSREVHSAAVVPVLFTGAAHAPVAQITEDEPTAQFHPEGEGDYGYTLVTADNSSETAMAANVWPGSAAGNAGTLAEVLGAPSSAGALNDPAQASAATGSNTSKTTTTPSGTTMTASVVPTGPNDQHTTATSSSAGGGLGAAGSMGNTTSTSTMDFNSLTGLLAVLAESNASNVNIGGVVKIGSERSIASATAADGGTPALGGQTDVHDMSVAGRPAYVDGGGVHLGTPGHPASSAEVEAVDAALAASGMKIYFTDPHTVNIGGVFYYTAASLLFYWFPPGSHNTFTMSMGGAGVAASDTQNPTFVSSPTLPTSPSTVATATTTPATLPTVVTVPSTSGGTGPGAAAAVSSSQPDQSGGTKLQLPTSPTGNEPSAIPAAVRLPGGLGYGWLILIATTGLAAAALGTHVPRFLTKQAAADCPRGGKSRSSFGK